MPVIWMIIASFLFACMGVCVKLGADQFSTGELVFYRGALNIVMMTIASRMTHIALSTPHWRMQLSRSLSGSLALMCYFFTIGVLPLATAATLSYTSPMFVAILLILLFGERLRFAVAVALLAGFAGVVLLLRPTLQPGQWLGAITGLGAGMISSLAYISVRELGKAGEPEIRTVFWFSCVTTVLGGVWALTGELHRPDAGGLAILLGIGLFGGLAQLAMTRSYRFGKTVVSAALSYSTVIFASLFGMVIWDETHPPSAWLAIALIIVSGLMVSFASRRRADD